jgi:uncharacterized protein YndB with AHSA1/START domain
VSDPARGVTGNQPVETMKITESIIINAPPEQVWNFLADPDTWPNWNPKVAKVDRAQTGLLVPGEAFEAGFVLGQRTTNSQVKVRVMEPLRRLVLKQRPDPKERERFLRVEFEMAASDRGTRVVQTTDFTDSGMSRLTKGIMWLLSRIGRPQGQSPLDELKKKLEGGAKPG